MGAEPDDVSVWRSPEDGAYVIECRRPEALCPEMSRGAVRTGAGWVIATPDEDPDRAVLIERASDRVRTHTRGWRAARLETV